MQRRAFLGAAIGAAVIQASAFGKGCGISEVLPSLGGASPDALKPMALGLMIQPATGAEAAIARVKDLGLPTCFLSLDGYIGKFNASLAREIGGYLDKYGVTATSAEVVGPGRLVWDFLDGPSTIGLVPPATRAARIDALRQTSDFAKMLNIGRVQTHCGFLPENPRDPLYGEAVEAIRAVADHCAGNGQDLLMETGQETPTTMKRAIVDVNRPNLGVGLDTANLILYGKANPVDAVDMIGRYVRSVHAKDGRWPTDPMKLGEEVLIGTGNVDFVKVFTKLYEVGYKGAITIEREISGAQQIEDVKKEKAYLEGVIAQVQNGRG